MYNEDMMEAMHDFMLENLEDYALSNGYMKEDDVRYKDVVENIDNLSTSELLKLIAEFATEVTRRLTQPASLPTQLVGGAGSSLVGGQCVGVGEKI